MNRSAGEGGAAKRMGIFERFRKGLEKTRATLIDQLGSWMAGRRIDESFFEELEEVLIMADVGVATVMQLVEELRTEAKERKIRDAEELRPLLEEKIASRMRSRPADLNWNPEGTTVIMAVGVNGVGKTTTLGKLAHRFRQEEKKVLLAAGDTFRAGAIEQLEIWGHRTGAEVIRHQPGGDPAAVVYDAVQAAKARSVDVLLCDTAGRLHNKTNLMDELKKVYRVVHRELPGAPHEVLLVLDATTGQNALAQAKTFGEAAGVTGIVLTKLDGTAKGGIVIAIQNELGIPVKFVGLGEKPDDLAPFDPAAFVQALFARESDNR
jgi:fused signal recognition particle receptor